MSTITAATAEYLYDPDDISDGDGAPSRDGWTRVDGGAHHRTSRWHERYWLVLCDDAGELWGVDYGIGLTECQEHDLPWKEVTDGTEIPMVRLSVREVTSFVYEPA